MRALIVVAVLGLAASAQANPNVTTSVLPKSLLSDAGGTALSAAEATATAAAAKASAAGIAPAKLYPGGLYADCIRTADAYAAAFEAGKTACVAPWLYMRVPDSSADPFWLPGEPKPPADAVKFIKGPNIALSFVAGSDTLEFILTIKATSPPGTVIPTIFENLGIAPGAFPSGAQLPFKIMGSDATVYERTNKAVELSYAFFPDVFDRITRALKLNPRLLGFNPLQALQTAYSVQGTAAAPDPYSSLVSITGCSSTGTGTCPDLNSATATAAPGCGPYYATLSQFCATNAETGLKQQNYDSVSCGVTLAAQPVDATGAVSALTARAFLAACFDFAAGPNADNSDNGFAFGGAQPNGASPYVSREYLINGDRLLSQTGGSTIIWLPVA